MCDTCKREGRETFVHCSSVGSMSISSCRECLDRLAEPMFSFEYLYDFVSTDGDGLAEWVDGFSTFMDDRYMTWAEWKAWRQHPDRKDELDRKRDKDLQEYYGDGMG